jgi:hypothetical protein
MTTNRFPGDGRDGRARRTAPAAALALTALLSLGLGACSGHGTVAAVAHTQDTTAAAAETTDTDTATAYTAATTTTDAPTTDATTDPATDATTDSPTADDTTTTTADPTTDDPTVDETTADPTTADDSSGGLGDYHGTAKVTVTAYDYCGGQFGGERRLLGTQTYSTQGELVLEHPADDGSETESNPFGLSFFAGSAGGNGSLMLKSAQSFQAGSTVMLQYWSLDGSPSSFSGELGQSHASEAAVVNQFWASGLLVACRPSLGTMPPMPLEVQEGARLSGHADGSSADLSFQGATVDGLYQFSVEFSS